MTLSFAEYLVAINFAPAVGIIFMLLYLFINSKMDIWAKKVFAIFLSAEAVELAAYSFELYTARWAEPTKLRILLSAIGYSARPAMIFLIFFLAKRIRLRSKTAFIYAIPVFINVIISFSAFFTDIAYSYDSDNIFIRGPLGYSSQLISILYFILILKVTILKVRKRSAMEAVIVLAGISLCVIAMVIEALYNVCSFGRQSIAMASIFYFMYFQSSSYERKMDELIEKTETDPLTGLLNKNSFIEKVNNILTQKSITRNAVFFIDLDNFKKYNDTKGHLDGDTLLKKIAASIASVFREGDYVGRFGGDEFYAFMGNVPYEVLRERAEKLCQSLVFFDGDVNFYVTASIGIAYANAAFSAEDMLRIADIALYDAKALGKNNYVIHTM